MCSINNSLYGQTDLSIASEFNLSVENYLETKCVDNWVCYQTYNGVILISLDEQGNFIEQTHIKEIGLNDFAISNNCLILAKFSVGDSLDTDLKFYDLTSTMPLLIHEQTLSNVIEPAIDIVDDYYVIGYRISHVRHTSVYSLSNYEQISTYTYGNLYEKVDDSKIMLYDGSGLYEIYEVTDSGELELLYSFDQYYDSALIDGNSLALKDRHKIDFYTISDTLVFEGSFHFEPSVPLAYRFIYRNGMIGYNRYSSGEHCYFDLVDVSDSDNPQVLDSISYFDLTEPDEIMFVFQCLMVNNDDNVYVSLANKPLIHLRVEGNSVSFVEMVEGYRSPTIYNHITTNRIFMQDFINLQITDISNPYAPEIIPNDYPVGNYQWYSTDSGLYCTRYYEASDYLHLYQVNSSI